MSTILVINSGSSSIKYQLVEPEGGRVLASGLVERIGESTGNIKHRSEKRTVDEPAVFPDHGAGLSAVLEKFESVGPDLAAANIVGVGHRVVQGGKTFSKATLIDEAVIRLVRDLQDLAPLHNPPALEGIEVATALMPNLPQAAIFDTAFFHSLPDAAATYAINAEAAERHNIRRYGAHGTSHRYVSRRVAEKLGRDDLKQIVLHLGNGASVSAVVNGEAVDTSMGLTPLEGLVMGTRTGDIDPAVVFHLARTAHMSIDEIDHLLNKQSGMKGMTGHNDMREVHALAQAGDRQAQLALEVYAHRLRKYIGAYTAVMGGLDVVSFTAGIGENDEIVRSMVMKNMEFFGLELDEYANVEFNRSEADISTASSRAKILIVPTNEELSIARQTVALI